MAEEPLKEPFRGELVIGLAGALGTRLDDLARQIESVLSRFAFGTSRVRVSDLVTRFPGWAGTKEKDEAARIAHLQKVANEIRTASQDGSILARAAIAAIREARAQITGDGSVPGSGHAFLVSQLKHPEEVALLRSVYGPAFILVAGHAERGRRVTCLAKQIAVSLNRSADVDTFKGKASDLIEADQKSLPEFGQNMQDVFPLADMFVDLNSTGGEYRVERYFDLEFGHPFLTPTPQEVAMYQASAVALRSSDFNRQVGAAIVQGEDDEAGDVTDVEILALGMNEVPKAGGGYYWGGESPDCRDQAGGEERVRQIKVDMLAELVEKMGDAGLIAANKPVAELAQDLLPALKGTRFAAIGEFSRPVHAEVAAIIDAARRGVRIDGGSLFVTTFPCHNCAKHIIAAGIRKVIYLEPYPKSRAGTLYEEEVCLDAASAGTVPRGAKAISFKVYSGVAPRKYRTLFSMAERGARQGLSKEAWELNRGNLRPLHVPPFLHGAYLLAEAAELEKLKSTRFA
ncbi:MAG TPA: deaminase [Allosphingosinicella sp.]|jgi:cytidine deaminase